MSNSHRRRTTNAVNSHAMSGMTFDMPTPSPVPSQDQINKEIIVKPILNVFNHYVSLQHSHLSKSEVKHIENNMTNLITTIFMKHPDYALYTLDVLLSNYCYYCKKSKVKTELDGLLETFIPVISQCNVNIIYREKFGMFKTFIAKRNMMLSSGGSED